MLKPGDDLIVSQCEAAAAFGRLCVETARLDDDAST